MYTDKTITITTYTGKHIDPMNPEAEMLDIEDIAHALPYLCRGNGHVRTFFSVGQHCINCAREAEARGLPPRVILACLIHDASECYLSDVPRPVKIRMPEYKEQENRLLDMIYEKFLGTPLMEEEKAIVKGIDDDMLWYDMTELLRQEMDRPKPELHIYLNFSWRPFADVEEEYLDLYRTYAPKVQ